VRFWTQLMAHFTTYFIEDLEVGMEASHEKQITEEDIEAFADLSGDRNPMHLCEEFAARTRFKTRIAHGMLTASFISTVLGMQLPGPGAIYVSQTLRFKAPVHIGDRVRTTARLTSLDRARRHAAFDCSCEVAGNIVLEGEALVMVPARG